MRHVLLLNLLCSIIGFSQNIGYFGKKSSLGISISGMPTVRNTFSIDLESQIVSRRRRFAYLSYNLEYSVSVSRRVELDFAYTYSKVRTYTNGLHYVYKPNYPSPPTYNFHYLNDPVFNYNQLTFGLKFYRLGSITPVGKYLGFQITYGRVEVDNALLHLGIKGLPIKDSRFSGKHPYSAYNSQTRSLSLRTYQLILRIGRNYPINQHFSFGGEVLVPVSTVNKTNGNWSYREVDEYFSPQGSAAVLKKSVQKYNFIKFKMSIYFHW